MKKLLLIYKFEWKNLIANRVMVLIFLLLIMSGAYSIYYGQSEIKQQKQRIAYLKKQEQIRLDTIRQRMKADTSIQVNKAAFQRATNPAQLNRFVKTYAINPPAPMASLSLGQRDLQPYYLRLDATAFYKQINTSEIKNPLKLFTGNFDLAFVLVYLFPLVIILLTYDIYSAEKEQGTLPLLASQPLQVSQVMGAKLSFRLLLVLGLGLLLTLLGVLLNGIAVSAQVGQWLGVVSVYIVFWFALMYGVVFLRKSSAFNAIIGLGTYLVLTLVLPALLNIIINIQAPPPAKNEMTNMIRTQFTNQWGNPKSWVFNDFYPKYPQYNDGDTLSFNKWFYAGYLLMDEKAHKIQQKFKEQMQKRQALSKRWLWITPAALVQEKLNEIAQTDYQAQQRYLQKAQEFHAKLKNFYYPKIFKDQKMTVQELDKLLFYGVK
ncbi:DUF3526 domain-containing protein [Microscilla marina]|uniref:ABC transporter permease n=1 Tax=Microscilla marina ATCC 23134 TaxID=313606 RepID=A1ZNW8_MICM2|nr:DUF3526 domain-containing protein [Microscilla marina]EAY28007.1 conserved hypothetical protein [Microscilla marina ATCC 23134]